VEDGKEEMEGNEEGGEEVGEGVDMDAEDDPYMNLTASTIYTHKARGRPDEGCELFDRRRDDDILAIAAALKYAHTTAHTHTA
jgi:hypothetical protein